MKLRKTWLLLLFVTSILLTILSVTPVIAFMGITAQNNQGFADSFTEDPQTTTIRNSEDSNRNSVVHADIHLAKHTD